MLSTEQLRELVDKEIKKICESDRSFTLIDFQRQLPAAVTYEFERADQHITCFFSIILTGFYASESNKTALQIEITWRTHSSTDYQSFIWNESEGWHDNNGPPIKNFRIILSL